MVTLGRRVEMTRVGAAATKGVAPETMAAMTKPAKRKGVGEYDEAYP